MKNQLKLIILLIYSFYSCSEGKPSKNDNSPAVEYDVIFRENHAGTYKKWQTGKRQFKFQYSYSDRGRGPKYDETITLSPKNYITSQTITGVNYRKVKVNEHFSIKDTIAKWVNPKEISEGSYNDDQLYFRYNGSPAAYEIIAQLLLASHRNEIKLYPQGTVTLTENKTIQLPDGNKSNLLMLKGLDMNPVYLWMKGTEMIASISGNLHVIRKDFKELRLTLKKKQDSIEDIYLKNIASKVSHSFDTLVIKNATIFLENGSLAPKQDVLVMGSIISKIAPANTLTIPKNAKILDASNKILLPGMFDMHTHNNKFRGLLHIAGGITSVRDLANNKQLKQLSEQFNTNEIIGPRIVTFSGIIDGPGPFANQRNVVNNLNEALIEIQDYKNLGYDQIKLYSSIKPEWVRPLAKKAHELEMRVSGHIPAFMTASQAIEQGYNEIQHMNMLFLNFQSDTIDTRTPLRFTEVAKNGIDLDLNSSEYKNFISLLKRNDVLIDPTISIFENMFISKKGEPSPTYEKIMHRLPLINQRLFYAGGLPKNAETTPLYQESFNKMLAVVKDLFQKNVSITPGTDGLPGFLYHRELELYVKAGIPANKVLQLATIIAAELTGVAHEYGSIEEGKKADLILINGNPLEDISAIRKVDCTIKEGKLFYAKELYGTMGIKNYDQ